MACHYDKFFGKDEIELISTEVCFQVGFDFFFANVVDMGCGGVRSTILRT